MAGEILVPLLVIALILLLVVLLVAVFILRRYLLTRPVGTFDCSIRREGAQGTSGGWMLGVARYESDRLEWFRIFTMSPRPERVLSRARLLILDRRRPTRAESYAVMPQAFIVRCGYGSGTLELAMSEAAYNGFATWLESAPPGVPLPQM